MVVVSDTSPVSGLYRINHLFVLERLFGKVILPNSVFQEILELRSFGYDLKEILTAEWIEVKSAADVSAVEYLLGCDQKQSSFRDTDPGGRRLGGVWFAWERLLKLN